MRGALRGTAWQSAQGYALAKVVLFRIVNPRACNTTSISLLRTVHIGLPFVHDPGSCLGVGAETWLRLRTGSPRNATI